MKRFQFEGIRHVYFWSMPQSTDHVFLIRPVAFRFNEQTAVNNLFQAPLQNLTPEEISSRVLGEFDNLVQQLRSHDIKVSVFDDSPFPDKPDSLFPNNWISFHEDETTVLYPMFAPNRRWERRMDILHHLRPDGRIIDFSVAENDGQFLEGTGSLVLDRVSRIAYAAISPRTDAGLVHTWAEKMNYSVVKFHAYQTHLEKRQLVYHTNVVLSVGTSVAVVCADCIDLQEEREMLLDTLQKSGKELLIISEEQVRQFAGNVLELKTQHGAKVFVMSDSAYQSLLKPQLDLLLAKGGIIHTDLSTIETLGGGSARCMLAEVF